MFAPRCAACDQNITPAKVSYLHNQEHSSLFPVLDLLIFVFYLQGSKETVRVVSMNKDYHVDCYICEVIH